MPEPSIAPLVETLIGGIADHIRAEGLPPGARLTERQLAAQFRVSRTPVREALRLLADQQVIEHVEGRGYVVSEASESRGVALIGAAPFAADDVGVYLRIAEDRLALRLPERITERELIRRYDLGRADLQRMIQRMVHEGWLERLPGYGWAFTPVLTSYARP